LILYHAHPFVDINSTVGFTFFRDNSLMALQNKTSSTSTSSKDTSLSSHLPLLKFHNFSPELYEQKQAQKIKKKRKSFTVNKNQLEPVNKITNMPNTRPLESSFQYHANHHYQQQHHHSQILPPHHHFIANTAELPQSIALPPPALTLLPSTLVTPTITPVVISHPTIPGAALVPHAVVSMDDQKKIFKMQLKNIMNDNDLPRPLHRSKNYHLNGDSMIDEDDEDEEEFADNEQDLNCRNNNNDNNNGHHNNQKQQFGSFDNSAFRLKESKRNSGPNLKHLDPNFTIPVTHTLYHIECTSSDATIKPNFPDRIPMERGTGRGDAFLPNELVQ